MDQTTFRRGEGDQVGVHLFLHHLWTTFGSISLGGGGGVLVNLEHICMWARPIPWARQAFPESEKNRKFKNEKNTRKFEKTKIRKFEKWKFEKKNEERNFMNLWFFNWQRKQRLEDVFLLFDVVKIEKSEIHKCLNFWNVWITCYSTTTTSAAFCQCSLLAGGGYLEAKIIFVFFRTSKIQRFKKNELLNFWNLWIYDKLGKIR